MNRISQEVFDKCATIEDLLDVHTKNGELNFAEIGNDGKDYSSFLRRFEFYKDYLKESIPELSTEEILKFDSLFHKFRDVVYAMNGHYIFLTALEFENEKSKQLPEFIFAKNEWVETDISKTGWASLYGWQSSTGEDINLYEIDREVEHDKFGNPISAIFKLKK